MQNKTTTYNKIVTEEKHNSETLYQIINKICKLKNSKRIFPTNLLNDKGNVTTKPEEIANVLNEHFASVEYKMAQDIPAPPSHIKMTKPIVVISTQYSYFHPQTLKYVQ